MTGKEGCQATHVDAYIAAPTVAYLSTRIRDLQPQTAVVLRQNVVNDIQVQFCRHPGWVSPSLQGSGYIDEPEHLRLAEAPWALTGNAIVHCGRTTATALRSLFGIAAPRLAVAALNPHAGEHGTFGHEEATIIAPAVARLRADGLAVAGPAPADTLFHAAARATYDAAMCMYHDQALIPLKTIDFRRGVNVTLGLPIIRTSPDHGTALDIAGKGIADATSLIEALRLAAELAANADAGG